MGDHPRTIPHAACSAVIYRNAALAFSAPCRVRATAGLEPERIVCVRPKRSASVVVVGRGGVTVYIACKPDTVCPVSSTCEGRMAKGGDRQT